MLSREGFHKLVADVFGQPLASISDSSPVGRSSFDKAKLAAVLERHTGRKVPAVHTARTLGELEAHLFGDTLPATSTTPIFPTSNVFEMGSVVGLRCGIDIEPVASMPVASDYWEDAFYKATFSPAEMAYCLTQQEPRMHFAARWCAKEALRKCDSRFAEVAASKIELVNEIGREIFLRLKTGEGEGVRLPHAVSITHTPDLAAATVVAMS